MKLNTSLIVVLFSAIVAPGLVYAGPLTEMDIVNLEEASNPRVAPGGHDLVYSVRSTDYEADKFLSSIWLVRLDDLPNGRRLRPLEDLQKGWAAALSNFSYLNGSRACALLRRLHGGLDGGRVERTVAVPGVA
jgi:hypothetical protein